MLFSLLQTSAGEQPSICSQQFLPLWITQLHISSSFYLRCILVQFNAFIPRVNRLILRAIPASNRSVSTSAIAVIPTFSATMITFCCEMEVVIMQSAKMFVADLTYASEIMKHNNAT